MEGCDTCGALARAGDPTCATCGAELWTDVSVPAASQPIPIPIRRYGRVPPPPIGFLEDARAAAPGFPWWRLLLTLGGLAVAAGAAASVSLLLN